MSYLLNNFNGNIAKPETLVKIEKKDEKIIFNFEAFDSCLFSYSNRNNAPLWKGCVCEVFLDVGDDFYYEFEVAPNGKTFIAKIKDKKVTFIKQNFFYSKVAISDNKYCVTMEIDLAKLNNPKIIKYNCFRLETKPNEKKQNLSALNPTLCDTFHVREKFIILN